MMTSRAGGGGGGEGIRKGRERRPQGWPSVRPAVCLSVCLPDEYGNGGSAVVTFRPLAAAGRTGIIQQSPNLFI